MSCTLEPAIRLRDTGQQMPCFGRCQLIITWMSKIKAVHGKPRLLVFVNLLFGVWPSCCATPPSSSLPPSSCVRAHEQCFWTWPPWENQLMGFLFFPIWVWSSAINLHTGMFRYEFVVKKRFFWALWVLFFLAKMRSKWVKKPKTPRCGASCISKTTKQQQVGQLVFADFSLE